jgi:hypothetical protein
VAVVRGRPYAELLPTGEVVLYAVKAVFVLTAGEILALLPSCRSLWVVALRRGKLYRRSEDTMRRAANGGAG